MNRDEEILVDLLRYAKLAARRVQNRTEDELDADADLQSLLFHPLIIIGEAVKRLSAEFRARSPEIPWEKSRECEIGSFAPMIVLIGKSSGTRSRCICPADRFPREERHCGMSAGIIQLIIDSRYESRRKTKPYE